MLILSISSPFSVVVVVVVVLPFLTGLPIPMESAWSLPRRVTACLYYLRRLVNGVLHSSEDGLQHSLGRRSERLKTRIFEKWFQRWLIQQRYHRKIRQQLLQTIHTLDSDEETQQRTMVIEQVCRHGLYETMYGAVEEWEIEEEEESRWKRGMIPIIQLFKKIQIQTRPIDKIRQQKHKQQQQQQQSHVGDVDDSITFELESSRQSDSITSLLLANYVEWLLFAVLGERALVEFIDVCLIAKT